MSKLLSLVASPTALLYLFVTAAEVVSGFYLAGDLEPPPAFSLLYVLGFLWVMGWWLLNDSQRRGIGRVLDIGLFLYIAWPLIMPYYLLKTGGAIGLLAITAFTGV